MASLATIATVATGAAAVVGAGATIYQGYQQQKQYEEQKRQQAHELEKAGRADFASAQRDAMEKRLQGQLILSQQQAAAAASGGGAGTDDPTIVRLMSETSKRTEYSAQTSLWAGKASRDAAFESAANLRRSRSGSFVGSLIAGIGQLVGGAADTVNIADRYSLLTPAPATT